MLSQAIQASSLHDPRYHLDCAEGRLCVCAQGCYPRSSPTWATTMCWRMMLCSCTSRSSWQLSGAWGPNQLHRYSRTARAEQMQDQHSTDIVRCLIHGGLQDKAPLRDLGREGIDKGSLPIFMWMQGQGLIEDLVSDLATLFTGKFDVKKTTSRVDRQLWLPTGPTAQRFLLSSHDLMAHRVSLTHPGYQHNISARGAEQGPLGA